MKMIFPTVWRLEEDVSSMSGLILLYRLLLLLIPLDFSEIKITVTESHLCFMCWLSQSSAKCWKVKLVCHGRAFLHTEVVYFRNMIKTNINERNGKFHSMMSFDALTYVIYWPPYCPYHCFLSGDGFCFRASAFFLIICHWLTWLP